MKRDTIAPRILLFALLAALPGAASAGPLILYQGSLHDLSGTPKSGTFLLNFEIRSAGGSWEKAVFVRARNGSYRVSLGAEKEIPESLLSGDFEVSAAAPSGGGWVSQAAAKPLVVRSGKAAPSSAGAIRSPSDAAAPHIDYEGTLTDAAGVPKSGNYLLRFQIYPGIDGDKLAWESAHYVRIENGRFQARLGEKTPLPVETLRGIYRIKAAPPPGLDWVAKASGVPIVRGIAPRPFSSVTSGDAASSALESVRKEMGRVRKEVKKAKQEAETSRKRVQALEDRLLQEGRSPAGPAKRDSVYVVKSGETLRTIARTVYGDESRWVEIYQANHDRVLRGGEVTVGQKLLIPASQTRR